MRKVLLFCWFASFVLFPPRKSDWFVLLQNTAHITMLLFLFYCCQLMKLCIFKSFMRKWDRKMIPIYWKVWRWRNEKNSNKEEDENIPLEGKSRWLQYCCCTCLDFRNCVLAFNLFTSCTRTRLIFFYLLFRDSSHTFHWLLSTLVFRFYLVWEKCLQLREASNAQIIWNWVIEHTSIHTYSKAIQVRTPC